MSTLKVRKNFIFDKDLVEQANTLLKKKKKNFTEAITLYLKAITKEPSILDEIEKSANRRTGSFIGMLDGKIGDENFRDMKAKYHEHIS